MPCFFSRCAVAGVSAMALLSQGCSPESRSAPEPHQVQEEGEHESCAAFKKAHADKFTVTCYASKEELLADNSWCRQQSEGQPGAGIPRKIQGLFWMKDCPAMERELAFCSSIGSWDGKKSMRQTPAYTFVFEDSHGGYKLFWQMYLNSMFDNIPMGFQETDYTVDFKDDSNTWATSSPHNVGGFTTMVFAATKRWSFIQRDTAGNVWDRFLNSGLLGNTMYQAVRLAAWDANGNDISENDSNGLNLELKPGQQWSTHKILDSYSDEHKEVLSNVNKYLTSSGSEERFGKVYDKTGELITMVTSTSGKESFSVSDIRKLFLQDPYSEPKIVGTSYKPFKSKYFRVSPLNV